jgi:hypothetical protein
MGCNTEASHPSGTPKEELVEPEAELAELIMGQVNHQTSSQLTEVPTEECSIGILLKQLKATRGTELLYNGQGEYKEEHP